MHLLDTSPPLSPVAFAVGPAPAAPEPTAISVSGATLLHAPRMSPVTAEAALKSLRGFRAAGRRVVWCNSSELAATPNSDLRAWGRKLVDVAAAEMLVAEGAGSRDLAVAARDAGMALSRVVVCRDDATARNVLCDSIAAGDTVLALGVSVDNCNRLAERLESRFEREFATAS